MARLMEMLKDSRWACLKASSLEKPRENRTECLSAVRLVPCLVTRKVEMKEKWLEMLKAGTMASLLVN